MVVDMSKLTCSELTKLGFQDFAGVTMWMSGYYNSSVRNTVVDLDQYARAAKAVKDFCQRNTRATVMPAAETRAGNQDAKVIPVCPATKRDSAVDRVSPVGRRPGKDRFAAGNDMAVKRSARMMWVVSNQSGCPFSR
jgi:acid stress chaperone HdeB